MDILYIELSALFHSLSKMMNTVTSLQGISVSNLPVMIRNEVTEENPKTTLNYPSMSVSSCRCMCVSCVHPVTVLNAAFCMTCSLLMLVEDVKGEHIYGRGILQSRSRDCLIDSNGCLFLFTPFCCGEFFYYL